MDEVRPIDGNALEQEMRGFAIQIWVDGKDTSASTREETAEACADMVSNAPTLIHALSEWRKPTDPLPTRKDANKNGCILAVHKLFDFDVDWWHFSTVANNPEDFYCWYPTPEPPEELLK